MALQDPWGPGTTMANPCHIILISDLATDEQTGPEVHIQLLPYRGANVTAQNHIRHHHGNGHWGFTDALPIKPFRTLPHASPMGPGGGGTKFPFDLIIKIMHPCVDLAFPLLLANEYCVGWGVEETS